MAQPRNQIHPGAERPVHVKPEPFALADICQRLDVVYCAGIDCAGCPNNAEWSKTSLAVVDDGRFERLEIDLELLVGWHLAERIAPQPPR